MSNFFSVKNLSSRNLERLPGDPWAASIIPPSFPTKEAFRRWCVDPSTNHAFISLVEPVNPLVRCNNTDNPAKWMRGYIADFDSPKLVGRPTSELVSDILFSCNQRRVLQPPNWICRTFSGKARLIWLFEDDVPVDSEPVRAAFMRLLMDEMSVDRMLVGGRDTTSDKADHMFEIGTGWTQVSPDPVPSDITARWFYEAAKVARTAPNTRAAIPIEELAKEVERQFPGRWQGPFDYGTRGPLFWIPDGIERVGCQVGDHGMICYSDRAGASFLDWGAVLGRDFVAKYESKCIAAATSDVYYDGSKYYEYDADAHTVSVISKDDLCLRYRVAGFSDEKTRKATASEIDNLRHFINTEHRVVGAVPLVHFKPGLVEIKDKKYFNLRCQRVVQPADDGDPSKWPFLHSFLTNIFDPTPMHGHMPHVFFFAWMKRFYEGALNFVPNQGHGIILTGEAGQGKTFLGSRIMADLMGGCEDASRILSGRTDFSGNLAGAPVWSIDDTTSTPDYNQRRLFGEMLKQQIANPFVDYHPKYGDAQRVAWHGRVIITCNADSNSLDVIPNLEPSILDKLHLFKTSSYRHPFKSNEENEAILAQEMPHLARWLLDWTPPADIHDGPRFGAKPYHHPFVRKVAAESSPEYVLTELLDEWISSYRDLTGHSFWEGSATKLQAELQVDPRIKEIARGWTAHKINKALAKLDQVYPNYKGTTHNGGRTSHRFEF